MGTTAETAVDGHIAAAEVVAATAVRAKYEAEREKRLRADGNAQYVTVRTSDKFKQLIEDPFVAPGTPVDSPVDDGGHTRFLIVGAGYGGILFAVKLIKEGYKPEDLVFVDPAGGFGGTWYWNRYPGLMCDVESYIYMPLLEEMGYMPQRKYASGEELRAYIESICRKYGLYGRAMFQSACTTMAWDDDSKRWTTEIKQSPKGGADTTVKVTSDYVFLGTGVLVNAKLPDLPGADSFAGEMFHTSRWRYDISGGTSADPQLTGLRGKKVAIIGTGATAIQAVPELAKWAEQLYVFQRTPASVDVRDNRPTDPVEWKTKIAAKPGWQRERNRNFNQHVNNASPKPDVDLVDDGWTHAPAYSGVIGGPYPDITYEQMEDHIEMLYSIDEGRQARVRKRVGQVVDDSKTAEDLTSWYATWCKRPCFHDEYLQAFNAPNVTLVDTKGKGVDAITPKGISYGGKVYEVDVLVWGTGFESSGSPAGMAGIEVTGRGGKNFDHEFDTNLSTLHGVVTRDFPNMFWAGPRQAGVTANQSFVLDNLTTHIAYIISTANRRLSLSPSDATDKHAVIEPTAAAQEAWTAECMSRAMLFAGVARCTPSYMNGEAAAARMSAEEAARAVRGSVWGRGIETFLERIEQWRANGKMEGIEVSM